MVYNLFNINIKEKQWHAVQYLLSMYIQQDNDYIK